MFSQVTLFKDHRYYSHHLVHPNISITRDNPIQPEKTLDSANRHAAHHIDDPTFVCLFSNKSQLSHFTTTLN